MIALSKIYGPQDDTIPQALAIGIEVEDITTGKAIVLVMSDAGDLQLLDWSHAKVLANIFGVNAGPGIESIYRLTKAEALRVLAPHDLSQWRATGRYLLEDNQPWKRVLVSQFHDYREASAQTSVGVGSVLRLHSELGTITDTDVVLIGCDRHDGGRRTLQAMCLASCTPWSSPVLVDDQMDLTMDELGTITGSCDPTFPHWYYLGQLSEWTAPETADAQMPTSQPEPQGDRVTEALEPLRQLASEIDRRCRHGASGAEHLRYVKKELRRIMVKVETE